MRPFGYFVHHQGRGHAERLADLAWALPRERPLTVFCAKTEIFPVLPDHVEVVAIPSLFERQGDEAPGGDLPTPDTLHCAPVGWPGIRRAMGLMSDWFAREDPELMVSDVSAEVAQLARLCSVPHVKVLQHGDRSDPGHRAAYDGAVGLLAPFDAVLAQPDWTPAMLGKTHFAPGLGVRGNAPDQAVARRALGVGEGQNVILVIAGAGGSGFGQAPLGVGARARPDSLWLTIGPVERDWHATEPSNLRHCGWVTQPQLHLAAADLVVASTGNTTTQMILAAGKPWLAVPEWRYFDEQHRKADCLAHAGLATVRAHLPSSPEAWRTAIDQALLTHNPARQRAAAGEGGAVRAAAWLEDLADQVWRRQGDPDALLLSIGSSHV